MDVAKRQGSKRAKVALARKIGVILHRMWIDGTTYRWAEAKPIAAQGWSRRRRKRAEQRPLLPEVPSPGRWSWWSRYTPSGRHPTNHAYLDRLTVPSDSIVWRPRRRPRTEAWTRRRDDHSGRL